jgi:hypothetical protein
MAASSIPRPGDGPLLRRVKALRQVVPGVKLSEAKRIVESGADEALMRAFDLVMEQHRSSVRAERRERIATRLLAGYCANPRAGDASMTREALAELACLMADALVAELDRRRDAELQEARDA